MLRSGRIGPASAGLFAFLLVWGRWGAIPAWAAAVATNPSGLAVTPAIATTGDTVVWTIFGPAGSTAVLAFSRAGSGASYQGVPLALGPDFQILMASSISGQGRFDFALRVPNTAPPAQYFFQAATIQADRVTLTNGVSVTVQPLPPRGSFY